ncbi:hypothetical protein Lalb_Chr21g0304921 [Lupinus albus]|uniref:Uncharacterized protein n=1 Tax=Lupinus albus TaxID=3870 RepID=A0A6A4NR25_LUPAL|nr:hypothetical protein Lalb_Chr21g0304921 [Lupinus albus]
MKEVVQHVFYLNDTLYDLLLKIEVTRTLNFKVSRLNIILVLIYTRMALNPYLLEALSFFFPSLFLPY